MKVQPLIGQTFGRWTVLDDGIVKNKDRYYNCRCSCDGKIRLVARGRLISGDSKSCGCLRAEVTRLHLKGQKFCRITVIDDGISKEWVLYYLCRCECGKTIRVRSGDLRNGKVKSCGCLRREQTIKRSTIHGMSRRTRRTEKQKCIYACWCNIRRRCFDTGNPAFKDYGGRGIQICAQWSLDFMIFYRDMESTWFPGATIERIDNMGGYNRLSCKWETLGNQQRNRRDTILTQDDVDWIHVLANQAGWSTRLLADCRKVPYYVVWNALSGKTWQYRKAAQDQKKAKATK